MSQSSCAILASHPAFTHRRLNVKHKLTLTHSQRMDLATSPLFYCVRFNRVLYCNQKRVITDNVLSSLHCVIRIDAFLKLIFMKESYIF